MRNFAQKYRRISQKYQVFNNFVDSAVDGYRETLAIFKPCKPLLHLSVGVVWNKAENNIQPLAHRFGSHPGSILVLGLLPLLFSRLWSFLLYDFPIAVFVGLSIVLHLVRYVFLSINQWLSCLVYPVLRILISAVLSILFVYMLYVLVLPLYVYYWKSLFYCPWYCVAFDHLACWSLRQIFATSDFCHCDILDSWRSDLFHAPFCLLIVCSVWDV